MLGWYTAGQGSAGQVQGRAGTRQGRAVLHTAGKGSATATATLVWAGLRGGTTQRRKNQGARREGLWRKNQGARRGVVAGEARMAVSRGMALWQGRALSRRVGLEWLFVEVFGGSEWFSNGESDSVLRH